MSRHYTGWLHPDEKFTLYGAKQRAKFANELLRLRKAGRIVKAFGYRMEVRHGIRPV